MADLDGDQRADNLLHLEAGKGRLVPPSSSIGFSQAAPGVSATDRWPKANVIREVGLNVYFI